VLIVAGLGVKELIDPAAVDHSPITSTTARLKVPTTTVSQPLASAPVSPSQANPVPTPQVQVPPQQADNTLWLFSTIVFGCVVGCILITQRLLKSPLPPKGKRTLVRSSSKQKLSAAQPKPVRALAVAGRHVKSELEVLKRSSSSTQMTQQTIAKPAVTLVPDDESHPLDWGDESLANLMDLRKRKNLSSFL